MDVWDKIKPDEVIKVGWRTLVKKTFRQPDGQPTEYVTKDAMSKASGAVIALTADNQVVIAEQFRPGPEKIMQELPGGGFNSGEDGEAAVMRELREETGYASTDITYLGSVHKDAYTNTVNYYYLARNCVQSHGQDLDDGEFVTVKLITIADLLTNARTGMMTDTEAVLLAYDELCNIKGGK